MELYVIRNRGEVVTAACGWVMQHWRLALKIVILPITIIALVVMVNFLWIDNIVLYIIIALTVILVVPVLPNWMMHIVEYADETGYPKRLPSLRYLTSIWWRYYKAYPIFVCIYGFLTFISFFTIIGPLIVSGLAPLNISIYQREPENGLFSSIKKTLSFAFGNFSTLCFCILGSNIVTYTFIFAPMIMFLGLMIFIEQFVMSDFIRNFIAIFEQNIYFGIYGMAGSLFAYSYPFSIIIFHFMYGHCKENSEHPMLIKRIEDF